MTLDALVTAVKELVYKKEFQSQRSVEAAVNVIQAADYQGPDSETWNILTTLPNVRNEIAQVCGIRACTRLEDPPCGYALDPKEQHRLKLPRVDSTKIFLAGAPASMQPPEHINGIPVHFKASALPIDQLEECYLPILMHTDYVISKIERRIWG